MRYLLCIIAVLISFQAVAGDAPRRSISKNPQIAIQLSIANPCLNSHYAHLKTCQGQLTQHVVESTQQIPLRTSTGEIVTETPSGSYLVRTTDYY
ncbi:MAG: hypothetical protein REI95_10470 [Oxalicibacterium faecigallinarum]|uniref:Uncharacterized protein n=1 Tax=Oxalicibacterium faecigallinarum TaxID=573741 RepID=A0A8J3APJ0_9BURK|nr:hypothetical protein [Oxalicibacterium faecigallinarum]MDQ7970057.1 hypothetical protein [Oxalicibacterium faecigallinarum]GGI18616.1 hypothetical protein GCM10008066_14970 [Oxalicibacterium faecigallinarum]